MGNIHDNYQKYKGFYNKNEKCSKKKKIRPCLEINVISTLFVQFEI